MVEKKTPLVDEWVLWRVCINFQNPLDFSANGKRKNKPNLEIYIATALFTPGCRKQFDKEVGNT